MSLARILADRCPQLLQFADDLLHGGLRGCSFHKHSSLRDNTGSPPETISNGLPENRPQSGEAQNYVKRPAQSRHGEPERQPTSETLL